MDVDDGVIEDPELAAAIEASYRAQTGAGMAASEDDLMAQALEMSRLEEEARQRGEAPLAPAPLAAGIPHGAPAPFNARSATDRSAGIGSGGVMTDDELAARMFQDDLDMAANLGGSDRFPADPPPAGGGRPMPGFPPGADDLAGMGMDVDGVPAAVRQPPADEEDPSLAAALEASYRAQTSAGMQASEEELMMQAIQMSQKEEDQRQRKELRDQQEMELKESELMDNMREQEEVRQKDEIEQLRVAEEQQQKDKVARQQQEQQQTATDLDAKRARVPPEPAADAPDRCDLMLRMRDGQRVRRCFSGSNTIGQIYDYLDVTCAEALAGQRYRIVQTMPRKAFEDRNESITSAGLKGQCALMVEAIQAD